MANKIIRKVSFYLLTLDNNDTKHCLKTDEVENEFVEIYEKMTDLSNGSKAKSVTVAHVKYVVEIVSFKEHIAFIKIGRQNYSNTVALRDENTLETETVPMSPTQLLELFTYCIIDFTTQVISYIGVNGAPRISVIRELFNDSLLEEKKICANLAAITTHDILKILCSKKIISTLSLQISVPSNDVLEYLGVSDDFFNSSLEIKTKTITFKLTSNRNRSIFRSKNYLGQLIADITNKFGNNITKILVGAKDDGESSQMYDIFKYCFTKKVIIDEVDTTLMKAEDFQEILLKTYKENKIDILKYINI